MAAQTLLTVSRDEVERARLLSEYKFAVDYQSGMVNAKREGLEEGRTEEKYTVARNMLADNMSVELIAKFTGLSADEISELSKSTE